MSDSPYELQRLVTVRTFSTPWEAQIAQARLGSEGLHSLIANEHVIRMVALSNAVGGIQLKVREQDAEAAAAVLGRLAPLPEIYLVTHDASDASVAAATAPASVPDPRPVTVPARPAIAPPPDAGTAAGTVAGTAAGTVEEVAGAADGGEPRGGSAGCPSCGGADLRPEQSSRLVLGVLRVSRRSFRCGDCGSLWRPEEIGGAPRLDPGFPEADGEAREQDEDTALSTVARFHTPWEAHLARTFLESEGLRCCVLEERLPAVHLLSAQPVAYNRLEVRQADAARAAEILARAWSYPSLVALPDPDLDAAGADTDAAAPGRDAAGPGRDAAGPGRDGAGPDLDAAGRDRAGRDPGDPPAGR
jgi:Putative prokaryotic signal transducing protein